MLRNLCAAYRIGHQALTSELALTDREALAVRWMEALEYWSEELGSKEPERQMVIFRDKDEVEKLCRRILNNLPAKSSKG